MPRAKKETASEEFYRRTFLGQDQLLVHQHWRERTFQGDVEWPFHEESSCPPSKVGHCYFIEVLFCD